MAAVLSLLLAAVPAAAEPSNGGYFTLLSTASHPAMVYGNPSSDPAIGAEVFSLVDYYRKNGYEHILLWQDTDVRDSDLLGRPVLLVGSPKENGVLAAAAGRLPVEFTDSGFRFGGKEYGPGQGVVMAVMSPFDSTQVAVVHAGGTRAGALTTFTVPSGAFDWSVTARGRVLRRGYFLAGSEPLRVDPERDEDLEALRRERERTLLTLATGHFTYRYLPAHAGRIASLAAEDEASYETLRAFFGGKSLKRTVSTHLYGGVLEKEAVTGLKANAHSDVGRLEVHSVLSPSLDATGPHELAHLFAYAAWGQAGSRLMEEGAAVALTGSWWGRSLDDWGGNLWERSRVPPLSELAQDGALWKDRDEEAYPLAGNFFLHLVRQYGRERVKELYGVRLTAAGAAAASAEHSEREEAVPGAQRSGAAAGAERVLGAPWSTIEERWRADLAVQSRRR